MEYFIERCRRSNQHKSREFWYNSRVSRKRDSLFDIVPNIGKSVRPNFQCLEYRPEALVEWRVPTPPHSTATGKTPKDAHGAPARREGRSPLRPIHDRHFGELRKRIRRPQHIRNISVLGFVAKPLTFHNEKLNAMVRRVSSTRRTLFSCFSLRFLAAPATKRNFEGAPLFFSAPKRRHPVR